MTVCDAYNIAKFEVKRRINANEANKYILLTEKSHQKCIKVSYTSDMNIILPKQIPFEITSSKKIKDKELSIFHLNEQFKTNRIVELETCEELVDLFIEYQSLRSFRDGVFRF